MKSLLKIVFCLYLLASAGVTGAQDSTHHICTYFWKNNLPVNGVEIVIQGEGFLPVPFTFFIQGDPADYCHDLVPILPGPAGSYLEVFGSSENNYVNGVSIIDLQLISNHILGLQPLSSPYAIMAADGNKSGSITTFDIVEIRKVLLGIYTTLPNSTSWRFIRQGCTFPNPNNPFTGIDCPELLALNAGDTTALIGFKVGDVDGDAALDGNYQGIPTVDSASLVFPDLEFAAGEDLHIPVILNADFTVNGIQAEYSYDTSLLEILDQPFVGSAFSIQASNQSVFVEGRTRIVIFSSISAGNGDTLFWVNIHAKAAGTLQQAFGINQLALQPLLASDLVPYKLKLAFGEATAQHQPAGSSLRAQCSPNPFTDGTAIAFDLEQSTEVRLEVLDATGRRTYHWEGMLPVGGNRLDIPGMALPEGQMGVYRLMAGREIVTGKLVRR